MEGFTWIGLYRWPWKWSDGQLVHRTSFSDWIERQPDDIKKSCVTTTYSKLNARLCDNKYAFICSGELAALSSEKSMYTKIDCDMAIHFTVYLINIITLLSQNQ